MPLQGHTVALLPLGSLSSNGPSSLLSQTPAVSTPAGCFRDAASLEAHICELY